MQKSFMVTLGVFIVAIIWSTIPANAQWRHPEFDVYDALTGASVTIDGDAADWAGIPTLTGVEFEDQDGNVTAFQEFSNGQWSGPEDHESSIAFLWEPTAFYLSIVVTDDEHEHAALGDTSAWNGDGVQLAFEMTGERPALGADALLLYNFALGDDGNLQVHYESTLGVDAVDLAIVRDDDAKTTVYEARFSPDELGVTAYEADMEFGLGIAVNDGDLDSPGQTGWDGWYPHSIVFGKNAEKTGLVRLTTGTPSSVELAGKLAVTWGWIKER